MGFIKRQLLMTPPDHERVLESIARLTEKRDRESLELCLIQTMFELLPADEIALYQVENAQFGLLVWVNPEGSWSEDDVNRPDYLMPIANDPLFADCIGRRQMRVEPVSPRGWRYAFPIIRHNEGAGVLCLESTQDLSDDRRLIAGFLRIYQNYLTLIDESSHDKLTGLLNRKTFDDRFINIFLHHRHPADPTGRIRASERRLQDRGDRHWLALLDIDHFKQVNDNFGHLYGDEVLLLLANLMQRAFRRSDLLFRYGGEEFVVVLKAVTFEDTVNILERFRQTVELYNFPQVGQVTISIGFTEVRDSEIPTVIIERADRALYYAKEHGRNQVWSYEAMMAAGAQANVQNRSGGDVEMF